MTARTVQMLHYVSSDKICEYMNFFITPFLDRELHGIGTIFTNQKYLAQIMIWHHH